MTLDLGRRRTRCLPNSRGIAADPHPERHSCQCRPIIGRMAKKPPRKKRAAARPASKRPERQQDPRLVAVEAKGEKGEKLWVLVNSPVDLDDGSRLIWHPPQPVAFNLVEAKRFRDRGVKARTNIMAKLKKRPSGDELSPTNSGATIDCIRDLQTAVLLAFTAIESLANHFIDMLDDEFTLTYRKRTIAKKDLTRKLGLDDKLKRAVPKLDGAKRIAGTPVWGRYRNLKFLRDELLHVKQRGPTLTLRAALHMTVFLSVRRTGASRTRSQSLKACGRGFLPPHVTDAL